MLKYEGTPGRTRTEHEALLLLIFACPDEQITGLLDRALSDGELLAVAGREGSDRWLRFWSRNGMGEVRDYVISPDGTQVEAILVAS